jgi:phosphoglycolate phosphatase
MLDLDGTLADSTAGIVETFNKTLVSGGYAARAGYEIVPLIGLPLQAMFARFLPAPEHAAIPALVEAYRAIYAAEAIPTTRLFPGVAHTLAQLKHAGRLLSIASSKQRPTSHQVLTLCDVADLFDLIVGNDCVTQPKPNPEMLLLTLDQLGCRPGEALMVGDSVHDIVMGQAAGVDTCAVTYGAGAAAELQALKPTYIIDSFAALPETIHRRGAEARRRR